MNAWTTWMLLEGPGVARAAAPEPVPTVPAAPTAGAVLEPCPPVRGPARMAAPDAPSRSVPWIGPSVLPRRGMRVHLDEETA